MGRSGTTSIQLYVRLLMSISTPHGQQDLGVLTPCNHALREITERGQDRGRKINLEEPLEIV